MTSKRSKLSHKLRAGHSVNPWVALALVTTALASGCGTKEANDLLEKAGVDPSSIPTSIPTQFLPGSGSTPGLPVTGGTPSPSPVGSSLAAEPSEVPSAIANSTLGGALSRGSISNASPSPSAVATPASWVPKIEVAENQLAPPQIFYPPTQTSRSDLSDFLLAGTCEPGALLRLTGADQQDFQCSSQGTVSATIHKSSIGYYVYYLEQTQVGKIGSPSIAFSWTKIETGPSPSPSTSPPNSSFLVFPNTPLYVSNSTTLTLLGNCSLGDLITATRAGSGGEPDQTAVCQGNTFTLPLIRTTEGFATYLISKTGLGDTESSLGEPIQLSWILDLTPPSAPTLISPSLPQTTSSSMTFASTIGCETGNQVSLSGDGAASQICLESKAHFLINQLDEGNYAFQLTQQDSAGNKSAPLEVKWLRTPPPLLESPVSVTPSPEAPSPLPTTAPSPDAIATPTQTPTQAETTPPSNGPTNTPTDSPSSSPTPSPVPSPSTSPWIEPTPVPSIQLPPPGITTPPAQQTTTNASLFAVQGTCAAGAQVVISGDESQIITCENTGTFSASIQRQSDGTFQFLVLQTREGMISSSSVQLAWTRSTQQPEPPSILSPSTPNPFTSGSQLTLSGSCQSGAEVWLVGSSQNAFHTPCVGNSFSFDLTQTTNGTLTYQLSQLDLAGNRSSEVTFSWTRDSTVPAVPSLIYPTSSVISTSQGITILGQCSSGNTVTLTGDSTQNTPCVSGHFSFPISAPSEGVFTYQIQQRSLTSVNSQSASFSWVLDQTPPSALSPLSPTSVLSSSMSASYTLACEAGSKVIVTGDSSFSLNCTENSVLILVNKSEDGDYSFAARQMDAAGNVSPATVLSWTRNTVIPISPVLVDPPAAQVLTNTNSISLSGSCLPDHKVTLTPLTASSQTAPQSAPCLNWQFAFSLVEGADGTYSYDLTQTSASGVESLASHFQWTRSTIAPTGLRLLQPVETQHLGSESNLTLSGKCDPGTRVLLGGSNQQSTLCQGSDYSFTIFNSVDGSYAYSLWEIDPAGNQSSPILFQWIRNTVAPAAPSLISPQTSTYLSNESSFIVTVGCTPGNTVQLSGAMMDAKACAADSTAQFTLSQAADGTYNSILTQISASGVSSPSTLFSWTRDTLIPAPVVVVAPITQPYLSNSSNLKIEGTCTGSNTVQLSGSSLQTTNCSLGEFFFHITKTVDGPYSFQLVQKSASGVLSLPTDFSWIRNTLQPEAPTLTAPQPNPHLSADSNLTLVGSCNSGNTVTLSGSLDGSVVCGGGVFQFGLSAAHDGIYRYAVTQTDAYGNTSFPASFDWTRDTSSPPVPGISVPSTSPYISNSSTLVLSGNCSSGDRVGLSGADSQSQICSSGGFSFSIHKTQDGQYSFAVSQTSQTGISSPTTSLVWIRDTVSPAVPILLNPLSNPFVSSGSSIAFTGQCETGAQVRVAGVSQQNVPCVQGLFTFTNTQTADGTYSYSVTQTDLAGNSSAALPFSWTRDSTIPNTPVMTSPSTSLSYSNTNQINIRGTCTNGNDVTLSGASDQTAVCSGSAFSFTDLLPSEGIFNYSVFQTNAADTDSAQVNFTVIADRTVPSPVILTAPSISPYTSSGDLSISGKCESGSTVTLSGAETKETTCQNLAFQFIIKNLLDGQYSFSLSQTDLAGNVSQSTSLAWIRASIPPPPPGVSIPSTPTILSSASELVIQGTCASGAAVTLAGNVLATEIIAPQGRLSQTCLSSSFGYTISKPTDGQYSFTLTQSLNGLTSATTSLTWTRDSTPPVITVLSAPANGSVLGTSTVSISFTTTSATDKISCKLDAGPTVSCTSPVTYTGLQNGAHSVTIGAQDLAGNSTISPIQWTQAIYNTIALYHFNGNPGPMFDSSLYPSGINNSLNNNGSATVQAAGRFGQAINLNGTSQYLSAPHSQSQANLTRTFTAETHVNFAALPPASLASMSLISKTGSTGNLGWDFRLTRRSSRYYLSFVGSLNGTKSTEVLSPAISVSTAAGKYYHAAVVWNLGSVTFYLDGKKLATKRIGTSGTSTLFNSTAPLQLGKNATGSYLNGSLDEARISQTARWSATFTPPTQAYNPD